MSTERDRRGALMVVRAWRDAPGPDGVRARVWRAVGRSADLTMTERTVGSLGELEQAVGEWLERVGEDDWGAEP